MITNPSHRPLHSQVATLVAEREELFDDQDALREENASLKVQLEAAREQIHHLEQRHELVCSNGHALEEECRTLQEAVELFGTQATSASAAAKEAEARLADSEARCMKLHSEFVRTANGLHSERSAHDTDEAAHATAMEALRVELEAHDAELADRVADLQSCTPEDLRAMALPCCVTVRRFAEAPRDVPLWPGGEAETVSPANLDRYAAALAAWHTRDRFEPRLSHISEGFRSVVAHDGGVANRFAVDEFVALFCRGTRRPLTADLLPYLDPSKAITRLRIYGFSGGDGTPDSVLIDDVQLCY